MSAVSRTVLGSLAMALWAATARVSPVPVDDSAALASAALQLLSDEGARQALAARGRATYARHFDVRHTISVLRRAMAESFASRS
jgi:hypothetical protein